MAIPTRKSQRLERSILKFKEDLKKFKENHKLISEEILKLTSELLKSKGKEKIEVMEHLEDFNYEMNNDILLNIEIIFENIGGFEIKLMDIDYYLTSIKEEQNILQDLELSAKNLIKSISVNDDILSNKEYENLNYLYDSYKKLLVKNQINLTNVCEELEQMFLKVKKMERI